MFMNVGEGFFFYYCFKLFFFSFFKIICLLRDLKNDLSSVLDPSYLCCQYYFHFFPPLKKSLAFDKSLYRFLVRVIRT